MMPHDTPDYGPSPLRQVYTLWQDRQTRDRLLRRLSELTDADLDRALLGSPEEAAKLLQEVAPDV